MKNLIKELALDLLKFFIMLAVVRVIVCLPGMEIQDKDMLIIVGAVFLFSWVVLAFIRGNGLSVAMNVMITTIWFYLKWGDFGLLYAQIALGSLLIMSAIIFVYELVDTLKKERSAWLPVLINAVVLVGVLFGLEAALPLLF